ncbi:hypothetical protein [Ruminococcus sp.]
MFLLPSKNLLIYLDIIYKKSKLSPKYYKNQGKRVQYYCHIL